VSRGKTIVDSDLLAALSAGCLAGATLDVFRHEPLAPNDPYWFAPNVLVASHTASAIDQAIGGQVISSNVLAFEAGERLPDVVDSDQGY
jgi:glyoxylate/hydroxypyruvate reductase A